MKTSKKWFSIPRLGEASIEKSENLTEEEIEEMEERRNGKIKKGVGIGLLALATGGVGYLIYKKLKNRDDDYEYDSDEDFEASDEE